MNNQQFRKLMLASSGKSSQNGDNSEKPSTPSGTSLGSRQRSSIPMTPRALGGAQADFARQLAERNNAKNPQKQFKTAAPRGSKLATGYTDRARERAAEEEKEDDREERIKALEELLKNEEIDQVTFDKMRSEIAGGDLESTHLIKGLDFKLLARVRRGEDVYSGKEAENEKEEEEEKELDVDDEFDQLEKQDVTAVEKEKAEKKKGQLSTIAPRGQKRSRDQILAELKASREAAKAKAKEPTLGNRFKRIGAKKEPGTRIERDSKGREVLIIVDEDGHEKRKVRKIQPNAQTDDSAEKDLLDKNAKPLGIEVEVPEEYREKKQEPEEDDGDVDIFDGVGDDYDPLAGMEDSDSDSDDEEKPKREESKTEEDGDTKAEADLSMAPPPKPQPAANRNYFKDAKTGLLSEETTKAPSMSDPAFMAAIKRAAALKKTSKDEDESDEEEDLDREEKKAREERRRKMLEISNRDDEDLDMGFGTSRYEDEEDFDDSKVKLSAWGGDDDGEEGSRGGRSKRKRGPKKRKGDANSAADVLRVMEQRKK